MWFTAHRRCVFKNMYTSSLILSNIVPYRDNSTIKRRRTSGRGRQVNAKTATSIRRATGEEGSITASESDNQMNTQRNVERREVFLENSSRKLSISSFITVAGQINYSIFSMSTHFHIAEWFTVAFDSFRNSSDISTQPSPRFMNPLYRRGHMPVRKTVFREPWLIF